MPMVPLETTPAKTGRSPLLNFRLGQGHRARLDQLVEMLGVSRSEVMRTALERYLDQELATLEEAPKAS